METPTLAQTLEDKAQLHEPHQNYCICCQVHRKTDGGLYRPTLNTDNHLFLRVLRTGPGFRRADSTRIEMDVQPGDVVLVANVGPLLLPGETELYHIRETDVVTTYRGAIEEVGVDLGRVTPELVAQAMPRRSVDLSENAVGAGGAEWYNHEKEGEADGVMLIMAKSKTGSRKV